MTKALRLRIAPGESAAGRPPGPVTVALTRALIGWERLWPILLPTLAPSFLILIASLFDIWRHVPEWTHWASLGLTLVATGLATLRFAPRFAWPNRTEALKRLEADAGLRHHPLLAIDDRPFGAGGSPLWRAHLDEMARLASRACLKGLRATADDVDPWALRFAAPGLLAVALVAAGPEWSNRLGAAFSPGVGTMANAGLADLWIEPPAYTGKAPIYLLRAGEPLSGLHAQIDAPEGSLAIAQVNNTRRFKLSLLTPAEETAAVKSEQSEGRSTLMLKSSGALQLRVGTAEGRWPIGVISDSPPSVEFLEQPGATDDARLAVALLVDDDYGVTSAALKLRLDPDQERPLDAPELDEVSIREQRSIPLDGLGGQAGERRFDLDLQSDPWAGLGVLVKVVVTDGAGQTGQSEEIATRLPARPFFNPLARAVIEQRQTLAIASTNWPRVGRSLDALTLAPDRFYDRSKNYLLVRTAFWRVMRQRDGDFKDTVEDFWPLALQLEDEALELARRRLEAAQDALRNALERGASDMEIARLVDELRQAMQQYLQALAQSGQTLAGENAQGAEALTAGDLEDMLDAINNLAQSGARNAARQALSDLENLLNNLRLSSRGGAGQGQAGEGQQGEGGPAGAAGDLIGRQRDLANRAFEESQAMGGNSDALAEEEGGLAGDLSKLLDELAAAGQGADPNGDGARALSEAFRNMEEAESALQRENFDAAMSAMEEAIARLRDGAEALAEAQGRKARQQMGENGESGVSTDPLGRPAGQADGRGVDVPDEFETRSAREVLEELRRRLSDGERNEDEVKYLERLLDWF